MSLLAFHFCFSLHICWLFTAWQYQRDGGGGSWGPTVLHMFLSFSVVALFVDCTN